jgi:hypothetical protein
MAKKPKDKNKTKAEPTETKKAICQYCKSHSNKPSKCKETGKYVPRKCEACEKYKEVK